MKYEQIWTISFKKIRIMTSGKMASQAREAEVTMTNDKTATAQQQRAP